MGDGKEYWRWKRLKDGKKFERKKIHIHDGPCKTAKHFGKEEKVSIFACGRG